MFQKLKRINRKGSGPFFIPRKTLCVKAINIAQSIGVVIEYDNIYKILKS